MTTPIMVDDDTEVCPACGNPADYCPGHGISGDPVGWGALNAHDVGDHHLCNVTSPCHAPTIEGSIQRRTRRMFPYLWNTEHGHHPAIWYENDEKQQDLHTATRWVLHLHVHPSLKLELLDDVSRRLAVTGEYLWGNSWTVWGRPAEAVEDMHMGIYYRAMPGNAQSVGRGLLAGRLTEFDWSITTAGDHSMWLAGETAHQLTG